MGRSESAQRAGLVARIYSIRRDTLAAADILGFTMAMLMLYNSIQEVGTMNISDKNRLNSLRRIV